MLIIGHRGAKGLAPENSLESIQSAISCGVDCVEIDIRTTLDNIPILAHDPSVGNLLISKNTLESLSKDKSDLPTLDQALKHIPDNTVLFIDIKPETNVEAVAASLAKLKLTNIYIGSFDFEILQRAKELIPNATLVVTESWSGVRASYRARKLDTKFVCMNHKWLWGGFVKSVKNSGYNLFAYTVNSPARAKKLKRYGVNGLVTDYPDRLLRL